MTDEKPRPLSLVEQRAHEIVAFLLDHRKQHFTLAQVRSALGHPDTRTTSDAFTLARRLAARMDEIITFCFSRDGEFVIVADPTDADFLRSFRTRARAITAQNVNLGDQLAAGGQRLSNPLMRRLAQRAAAATAGMVQMTDAFAGMAEDLADVDQSA